MVNVFPKLSETFIAGELAELRRRGVEVRILSLRRPPDELRHDLIARAGLTERVCYDPRDFPKLLRDFAPELLHAHFAIEPAAAAQELAAEILHGFDIALAPYPATEHDFYFSPLKLFEYMACGLPVAAARLGQIAEVVRDGETGLLDPAGDVEALTAVCDRLLD